MIGINKLYGILHGAVSAAGAYQWYEKKFTVCKSNDKINNILAVICLTVPEARRAMFACLICHAVLSTIFGKEIQELDPVNTYVPVGRPPESGNDDQRFCLFDLIGSTQSYQALKEYLDDDIKVKLQAPTFIDYIAAGCLQILRELRNEA